MDEERCPGCRGLIIDGVCPFCTSPIPGLQTLEPDPPKAPTAKPFSKGVCRAVDILVMVLGLLWVGLVVLFYRASRAYGSGGGPVSLRGGRVRAGRWAVL